MTTEISTGLCYDCKTREGTACPLCGKFVCDSCAEKPYAFCCDVEYGPDGELLPQAIDVKPRATPLQRKEPR